MYFYYCSKRTFCSAERLLLNTALKTWKIFAVYHKKTIFATDKQLKTAKQNENDS